MKFPVPPLPSKRQEHLIALGLVVTVVLVYAPTLGYPFIAFDDPGYVTDNAHVRAGLCWAGLRWAGATFQQSNWHPLTWLSLMLDATLFGSWAGGFHLTNLLLHAANTLLLFGWLRRSTGALWPPALVAFFFAAHPLHVESVAWVTERKDVLSTCLLLLSLHAYTRYALAPPGPAHRRARRGSYARALLFFALGLCAKPMLVSLPGLLLLLDGWPLRRWTAATWRAQCPRLLGEKLPFVLLAAASCVVTYQAQRGQAVVSLALLPLGFRLASAALGLGTYLQKTCWPVGLGVFYPYWYAVAWWRPLLCALGLLGLTALALGRARRQPYVLVGWLWFVGALVPVLGLVQVGSQAVADRYVYVPHIGLFMALAWAGAAGWARGGARTRAALGAGTLLLAGACLALGVRQARYWQSGAVLFAHAIAVAQPPSARLYLLYGDALVNNDREAEAVRAYEQSWRIGGGGHHQEVALRLSALWFKEGRWEKIITLLDPLSRTTDADEELLNLLASTLLQTGQTERARPLFQRCVEQYPAYAQGHFGLAECLRLQGDVPGACLELETGLARQDRVPALTYLAWTYAHLDAPAAHARSLVLATRAVDAGHGQDLASLHALAAAEAATGHWPEAVEAARNALTVANQPGAPAGTVEVCRGRLVSYEQGRLP